MGAGSAGSLGAGRQSRRRVAPRKALSRRPGHPHFLAGERGAIQALVQGSAIAALDSLVVGRPEYRLHGGSGRAADSGTLRDRSRPVVQGALARSPVGSTRGSGPDLELAVASVDPSRAGP